MTSNSTIFIETNLSESGFLKLVIPYPITVGQFKKAFPEIQEIWKKGSRLGKRENTKLENNSFLEHNSYYGFKGLDKDLYVFMKENPQRVFDILKNV